MARKKINPRSESVTCIACGLTITEPKPAPLIRAKLRALGWRFIDFGDGLVAGRCSKCLCGSQECSFYRPARFTGNLEDMVSPWMKQ